MASLRKNLVPCLPVRVCKASIIVFRPTSRTPLPVRMRPSRAMIPPTKRGKSAGETYHTFCTPPQLSFIGIWRACETTNSPKKKNSSPVKISALRNCSFSSIPVTLRLHLFSVEHQSQDWCSRSYSIMVSVFPG